MFLDLLERRIEWLDQTMAYVQGYVDEIVNNTDEAIKSRDTINSDYWITSLGKQSNIAEWMFGKEVYNQLMTLVDRLSDLQIAHHSLRSYQLDTSNSEILAAQGPDIREEKNKAFGEFIKQSMAFRNTVKPYIFVGDIR